MNELKEVTIYTDGACIGNPGPGGYGVVLLYLNHRKELAGGFRHTTNNRMEIFAVIVGLQALKTRCKVTVYSDSEYVVNAINLGWAVKWRSNNWQRTKSEKAKNFDLWKSLLELYSQHEVSFVWIKGHANNAENERCDQLSTKAASGKELAVDEVFESELQQPDKPALTLTDVQAAPSSQATVKSKVKITYEGQPCRKCQTPVIKRVPEKKNQKSSSYTFAYYFFCPSCKAMYMVEEAKQSATKPTNSEAANTSLPHLEISKDDQLGNDKPQHDNKRKLSSRGSGSWVDDSPILPPPVFLHDPRDSTDMLDKCPHGVLKIKKCAICDPEGFRANRGWD